MKTIIRDNILLETIKSRIRWDIRVSNSDICLKVSNGVVELNGLFDEEYRQAAANQIIGSTAGVLEIEDRSRVLRDYRRSNRDLIFLISKQISTLLLASGEWIDIDVADGVVKIEGQVCRPRLKAFAARMAWAHSGVRDCMNLIEVVDTPRSPVVELDFISIFSDSPVGPLAEMGG
jgi:hyperosmotically inducible protein